MMSQAPGYFEYYEQSDEVKAIETGNEVGKLEKTINQIGSSLEDVS